MDYDLVVQQADDEEAGGREDSARRILQEALDYAEREHHAEYACLLQAELAFLDHDYERALGLGSHALALMPDDYLVTRAVGVYLSVLNRNEEAVVLFDKALEIRPDGPDALLSKGITLGKLGREEEAITCFDKALEANPEDYGSLRERGTSLGKLGREEEALAWLDKAIEAEPDGYDALRCKGVTLVRLGREEESIVWFDKALEVKPNDFQSLREKGLALVKLGDYEFAKDLLDRAIGIAPSDPWSYHHAGRLAEETGDISAAVDCYNRARSYVCDEYDRQLLSFLDFKISHLSAAAGPGSQVLNEVLKALDTDKPGTFMGDIRKTREKLELFTSSERSVPRDFPSFFSVLRKWNSYTPVLPSATGDNLGGGYFLFHNGKGIVIDPGFNFVENFYNEGFKVADIDAVLITHAHNDHTVDLEAILSLMYKLNKDRKKGAIEGKEHGPDKKIDLLVNAGTFMKYSGWLSLHGDSSNNYVQSITVLHSGHSYNYAGLQIHAVRAKHHEIVTKDYAIGCVIQAAGEGGFKLGLTSDTGWDHDGSIEARFAEFAPDLMVVHLGSVKESEFGYDNAHTEAQKQSCYDRNHLGILGVTNVLSAIKPKLAVISEFGEELKEVRSTIAAALEKVLNSGGVNVRCLPGDIGLHIRLKDLGIRCFVSKDFVDYSAVVVKNTDTTNMASELIYHCKHEADAIYDRARADRSRWRMQSMKEKLEERT